jgi:hypothetical protein
MKANRLRTSPINDTFSHKCPDKFTLETSIGGSFLALGAFISNAI